MEAWRPQRYKQLGLDRGVDPEVLRNAVATGEQIVAVSADLPPVFTLRHLAHLTAVDYGFLRSVVSRETVAPYTTFRIRKVGRPAHKPEFRIICVPSPALMRAQSWIAHRILSLGRPHSASFAYARRSRILSAAELHCGCRWLIKLDVRRFFESISEISVYWVFRAFGYQPLVAFELARICTRLEETKTRRGQPNRWQVDWEREYSISTYKQDKIGHLPQGAPSSPMLSNLAMLDFDVAVSAVAKEHGLMYTRYADDLCLSTCDRDFTRTHATRIISKVYSAMGRVGLSPNFAKTRIVPPSARKVVLGLIVNGERPRLPREFRDRLRQHLHYLQHPDIGPARHAERRGFTSVQGLRNHVTGLVAFARQVDQTFGDACSKELASIAWPL